MNLSQDPRPRSQSKDGDESPAQWRRDQEGVVGAQPPRISQDSMNNWDGAVPSSCTYTSGGVQCAQPYPNNHNTTPTGPSNNPRVQHQTTADHDEVQMEPIAPGTRRSGDDALRRINETKVQDHSKGNAQQSPVSTSTTALVGSDGQGGSQVQSIRSNAACDPCEQKCFQHCDGKRIDGGDVSGSPISGAEPVGSKKLETVMLEAERRRSVEEGRGMRSQSVAPTLDHWGASHFAPVTASRTLHTEEGASNLSGRCAVTLGVCMDGVSQEGLADNVPHWFQSSESPHA
mmetsp:Transcript_5428/g.10363  ORF Transcript_5428/g.10363 Transcript_5428/m.10363 type:complete len:288 (+) Transcript_5428:3-866(+)